MLLPHGFDGQGPEHSSSRAERFLQLTNQDDEVPFDGINYRNRDILRETNLQVANCSTAANYFHLLRTQMRLPFRKPLVVVAPKKLLRFKGACSSIEEFGAGTRFLPLITDQNPKLLKPK
jgi:2-oxoglutarate dehydrogenase E1 component